MKSAVAEKQHYEWLRLVEVTGPFLSMPVLLKSMPAGLDRHDPDHLKALRLAYAEWNDGGRDAQAFQAWIGWVLRETLGYDDEALTEGDAIPEHLSVRLTEEAEMVRPSYVVMDEDTPLLLVLTAGPGEALDRPPAGSRGFTSWQTRMVDLLHASGVPVGLLTNGDDWMLVDAPVGETATFARWQAGLWLEEHLTLQAFRTLLGIHRLTREPDETPAGLFRRSAEEQEDVTVQLGKQVRRAVEVFIRSLDRADQEQHGDILRDVSPERLYEAALVVMMRLVFLFFAEERDLLLKGQDFYDENYSVSTLRGQLYDAEDKHTAEVLERRYDAWSRLLAVFRGMYAGVEHDQMRLRPYGGPLFDPDRFPFLEGRAEDTSWLDTPARVQLVNNRAVLRMLSALQELQVKVAGGWETRVLSFRELDIEQIGHVYESLLDHTATRAPETLLALQAKNEGEVHIPLAEIEGVRTRKGAGVLADFLHEKTGLTLSRFEKALAEPDLTDDPILRIACSQDEALYARVCPYAGFLRKDDLGRPLVIKANSFYVAEGQERRSSGTHYTPVTLTSPIVKHTLDPLVYNGPAEGLSEEEWTLKTARDILALKVCDMAMGSGAFLVQACRYLAERLAQAWGEPDETHPVAPFGEPSTGAQGEELIPRDPVERLTLARRKVAERCLFGVDINPLAVEMAKLSLWLVTAAKDCPFHFLDHALKCGDSLLGVDLDQMRRWSLDSQATLNPFLGLFVDGVIREAADLSRQLAAIPEYDIIGADHRRDLYARMERATRSARLGGDMLIAPVFSGRKGKALKDLSANMQTQFVGLLEADDDTPQREMAREYLVDRRPFHWPVEFPGVFQPEDGSAPGFDAMVGNPPFMGGKKITGNLGTKYRDYLVQHLARGRMGSADLCTYFHLRGADLLRTDGTFGLLATNSIAQGESREVGLGFITSNGYTIYRANPSQRWPGKASLEVAVIHGRRGSWEGDRDLCGRAVPAIDSYLMTPGTVAGDPYPLLENEKKSYQGAVVLGKGFVLSDQEATEILRTDERYRDCLNPYINGDELNSIHDQSPQRWIINFHDWPLDRRGNGSWEQLDSKRRSDVLRSGSVPQDYPGSVAEDYPELLRIVEREVKPERDRKKRKAYRERWWRYAERQPSLYAAMQHMREILVIAGSSETFAFTVAPTDVIYDHATYVVLRSGRSAFAVLQSCVYEFWARKHCSTLKGDFRFTPSRGLVTFPFPKDMADLEDIGDRYFLCRQQIMACCHQGLTETYNRFHDPNEDEPEIISLRDLHREMDRAVADAYGWTDLDLGHGFHETRQGVRYTISEEARREVLDRLLALNHARHAEEVAGELLQAQVAKPAKVKAAKPKKKARKPAEAHPTLPHIEAAVPAEPVAAPVPGPTPAEIEAALKTLLVARHRDPEMVRRLRPRPLETRAWPARVRPLHSIRLAKQVYGAQEIAGVPTGLRFIRKPKGPLSETFYESNAVAILKGWLQITGPDGNDEATTYDLGPSAEEGIRIAMETIGDHAQVLEDMLFFLDDENAEFAEQWMTIHKAWKDLMAAGKPANEDDVFAEVRQWKPERGDFTKGLVRIVYQYLKQRGYLQ